ncbi:transcription initiation factor TFIID subunit 6 [Marchantia polymorpha subsp. ruderalis]|nr:hypothetical protein MARPO_0040s0126 [Marchantia polymorpha]BBN03112.1 hypothetical protein Mp_2g20860 [Marchantia polymorpha subsp. ruderalis]|eukprot:PTQ40464.1 hypothetical protein MARPO_0040s0126 [Marchantia polymorpha]
MRHSKRSILTTDDVNSALSLRNVEPLYGFASGDPLRYRRALGHADLYYIEDRELDFKEIIDVPFPKAPLDTSVVAHWLAVEGVQPAIPENAPIEPITVPPEAKKVDGQAIVRKEEDALVEIKPPVKHVLSRELQLYFEKITEHIVSGSNPGLVRDCLVSLSTDSGLHPLVPYFTQFIADEVASSLDNFALLFSLMRVVQSLLLNPHIHIEPYLHQLMPSVITCLVAKRIGDKALENHWELRDFTASIVAFICKRFGHAYQNLQQRVTRTLVHAFLDPKRAMTQHYGAITGLSVLGLRVVQLLILPNLPPYLQLLAPELNFESQPNEMKRYEAWKVYGALQLGAGKWLYHNLKSHPEFFSAPGKSTTKAPPKAVTTFQESQASVNGLASPLTTSPSRKRVAAPDVANQSSQKKFAVDGAADVSSLSSTITDNVEAEATDLSVRTVDQGADGSKGRLPNRKSNPLAEAWKDDADIGGLFASLIESFGDGMLPFIPTRELCMFI